MAKQSLQQGRRTAAFPGSILLQGVSSCRRTNKMSRNRFQESGEHLGLEFIERCNHQQIKVTVDRALVQAG